MAEIGRAARQRAAAAALGVAVAARVPVLLWGAPGTGKTSAIRAMARAMGWPCETVIASIREPSDFAGLPVVIGQDVRFAPPAWARRLAEAGHGLLFLDELSTAPPAVQAALLRVVLERVVGDLELPPAVAVVAAANPPEQAADGWDLSAPLANRLCHLPWDIDPLAVADGLAAGFPAPQAPDLPDGWEAEQHLALALVAAFLHAPAGAGLGAASRRRQRGPWLAEPADLGDGREALGCERCRRRFRRGPLGARRRRGRRRRGRGVPGVADGDGPARPGGGAGRSRPRSGCPSGPTAPTPPSPPSPRWSRPTRRPSDGRLAGRSSGSRRTPHQTSRPSQRGCSPGAGQTAYRCLPRCGCSRPCCATPGYCRAELSIRSSPQG